MRPRRAVITPDPEPSINLTPLIDVVFVILILFIVIAPLLDVDRVELADANSSDEKTVSIQDAGPVSIHVHKDNKIMLNHQTVSLPELTIRLKQERVRHPDARPQLFHDKEGSFGTYQSVKNAVEQAGFDQLDVILKPT